MQLLQLTVTWIGGNATYLRVTGSLRGEMAFVAGTPIEREGMPAPFTFDLVAPLDPPGVEVDSALVEVQGATQGGHVVEFQGVDLTRRLTLEAGAHTYEVSLEPTIIEKLVPVIAPLMVMAMLGMFVVKLSRWRQ